MAGTREQIMTAEDASSSRMLAKRLGYEFRNQRHDPYHLPNPPLVKQPLGRCTTCNEDLDNPHPLGPHLPGCQELAATLTPKPKSPRTRNH